MSGFWLIYQGTKKASLLAPIASSYEEHDAVIQMFVQQTKDMLHEIDWMVVFLVIQISFEQSVLVGQINNISSNSIELLQEVEMEDAEALSSILIAANWRMLSRLLQKRQGD